MNKEILVTRASMPSLEEYVKEIEPLWQTRWLTNMGEKHHELEEKLSEYLDVQNTVLFTNGHAALECILEVLGLQGEVITTPFTFASTTNAIVRKGLTPVFCDIRADDFTIDVSRIEEKITDKTCAILPVHVYGNLCDVEGIEEIALKHGLKVIYDAAHAFGVTKDNVGVGNFGDVSMFSFHATKVFNTIEGGAAVFADGSLREIFNQWKNFGITGPESVKYVGGNAKMNEFCAAMGLCNLRHVDAAIDKRRMLVERYRKLLADVPGIQLSVIQPGVESNYAYFPMVIDSQAFGHTRDEVFEELEKHHVHARKYFYPLTNTFESFGGRFDPHETPVALDIAQRVLTMPLYEDLAIEDVDRICSIILKMRKE